MSLITYPSGPMLFIATTMNSLKFTTQNQLGISGSNVTDNGIVMQIAFSQYKVEIGRKIRRYKNKGFLRQDKKTADLLELRITQEEKRALFH